MDIPQPKTILKAVVMTAIAIALLKLAKPYAPAPLQNLLP